MSDNVTLNASTGTFISDADETAVGVYTQRVKVTFGVDGTRVDASSANPLPVALGASASVIGAVTQSGAWSITGPVAVTGALTDVQIRATPLPVAGTFFQATQPVSLAALPALATGANAIGSITNASFGISGTLPAFAETPTFNIGTAPSIAVTGTFFQATQPVSAASLPLPTGAASETTLSVLNTKTPSLGAALSAASSPVVIATDQAAFRIASERRDADTASVADGAASPIYSDETGRLKVSTQPASYIDVTGDITAIQPTINTPVAGGTVSGDVSRASNVTVFCTGVYAGVNVTFEGSIEATGDGNWFAIQAVRTNANTIELVTGVLSAVPAYAWELSVNGLSRFRVRATARTSGTQSWRFKQGSYATEPIPAAQISGTQPVSGTVTATVGTSTTGGTISPLTVAGVSIEASSAKTATGLGATITNGSGRGAHFFVNVSAASGTTTTLVVRLQVQDPVSLNWVDIPGAATAAITGISTTLLSVFPGVVEAANSKVSNALPRTYRMAWVIGGTTPSFTFSIGAQYII